jgi:hypothetical protein
VIPKPGGIVPHLEQCAAIAEIDSGETVENSLLAPPEGRSSVRSACYLYKHRPLAVPFLQPGSNRRDKETTDLEQQGEKEGTQKDRLEGTAGILQKEKEDRPFAVAGISGAGSSVPFTESAASVALLSLNGKESKFGAAGGPMPRIEGGSQGAGASKEGQESDP